MKKAISKALLRLAGWKLGPVVEDVPKCVICVAPHTSNWDFIVGKLCCLTGWAECLLTAVSGLR